MEKIDNLKIIFQELEKARTINSKTYPYVEMEETFNEELKELLSMTFGRDIKFNRDETFAYIQAYYKGVGIEINTFEGIILTIEDKSQSDLIKDFEPIFNQIVGLSPICQYLYCSKIEGTEYPTIEWSLNPKYRLYQLTCFSSTLGEYKKDFIDFHTVSIIRKLGENILTPEGYMQIMGEGYLQNDFDFFNYNKNLIKKIYSKIHSADIYNWRSENTKQKRLV